MKRYLGIGSIFAVLLAIAAVRAGNRNVYPLAEERGIAGTLAALKKLPVFVRVMQITAHPDDESAGTLTWLSRKSHAQTALFCLTRGEGGQNILGNEKYQALGLVRTGELLEASRFYGTELYFGSAVDFGFSKTSEETLSKWGREASLGDIVRFIRKWRPTIVISQFRGDAGDGHGHHQAAGILAIEAFRAASDPRKFPDQFKQGLIPWQAKKLYLASRGLAKPSFSGSKSRFAQVPVGSFDPVLGRSYREIGSEGYSKHRSQGNGAVFAFPGAAFEYYDLVDSVDGRLQSGDSLFDAIDTSLMAIWELAGGQKANVPFLREAIARAQKTAAEAINLFQIRHPEKSAVAVAAGARIISEALGRIEAASIPAESKQIIADALSGKLSDFQKALQALLGIRFVASAEGSTAVPGERVPINLTFYNQGTEKITLSGVALGVRPGQGSFEIPQGCLKSNILTGGESASCGIFFNLSPQAAFTKPFWRLESVTDARYSISPTDNPFAPFAPAEIEVEARYAFGGMEFPVRAIALAQAGDPRRGADFADFQVVPELSVDLNPDIAICPAGSEAKNCVFQVRLQNNNKDGARGKLRLVSPQGWRAEPEELPFNLTRKGETYAAKFMLQVPAGIRMGTYDIEAVASLGGNEFRSGYQTISYPENWTVNLYSEARARVEVFDVRVDRNLTVGYIPGAGDEIPAALEQLGVKSEVLEATDLAFGDLTRFSAIIAGVRAYNVNENLAANNQRLMEYVAQGGTLIVQYVRPTSRSSGSGSPFPFGPFPMSVSDSDRITAEDSPIRILAPGNPVFNRPNGITEADFSGWVQERGLYFMNSWDERYTPLLSGNDPGESPKDGGMLYARYGKGHYIYTGYSWFRQLPAGNPGAFRIFANMISLGRP